MDDHHQEVIAFCRENGYYGLIADDAEYATFDPPRYFSSENLKLTYKVCMFICNNYVVLCFCRFFLKVPVLHAWWRCGRERKNINELFS